MNSEKLATEEFYLKTGIYLDTGVLELIGEVDENTCGMVSAGLELMAKHRPGKPVTLKINSTGGDWYSGIGLFGQIANYDGKVTGVVQGAAMSMASIILQACDERIAYDHSTIMIHDGSEVVSGTSDTVLNWAKHSKEICERMYKIYASKSHKQVAFWRRKCKSDCILSPQKALELGLIDEVL